MKIKQYNLTVETLGNKWWRNFQSKDGHVRSEHIRHTTLLLMTWTAVRPTYARTDAIRWSTALSTGDLSHENDIIVGWELELLHLIAVLWNRGNCRLLLVSELLQLVKDRVSARISDFFGCTYDLEQHVVLYFKSLRRRLLFRIYKRVAWKTNFGYYPLSITTCNSNKTAPGGHHPYHLGPKQHQQVAMGGRLDESDWKERS